MSAYSELVAIPESLLTTYRVPPREQEPAHVVVILRVGGAVQGSGASYATNPDMAFEEAAQRALRAYRDKHPEAPHPEAPQAETQPPAPPLPASGSIPGVTHPVRVRVRKRP